MSLRGRGRDRLRTALQQALAAKEDRLDKIPAMAGRYDATGAQELDVSGRAGHIWARIRGQTSEVVQAFNDQTGVLFDMPILLVREPEQPRIYRVWGRDVGKYQEWDFPNLPRHGDQHSFGSVEAAGWDIVFVYKRQLAQPLLVHPQETLDMTVYVEADYFFWNNGYHYFDGASSADLTSLKPGAGLSRFVTIYLDGATGTVQTQLGATFFTLFPPSNRIGYIPVVDSGVGIPLAAVLLHSAITEIGWNDIYDIRALLSATGPVGRHGLDPSHGSHTGSLDALDVLLSDPSGEFSAQNAEDAFYELAQWSDENRMRSWMLGL